MTKYHILYPRAAFLWPSPFNLNATKFPFDLSPRYESCILSYLIAIISRGAGMSDLSNRLKDVVTYDTALIFVALVAIALSVLGILIY